MWPPWGPRSTGPRYIVLTKATLAPIYTIHARTADFDQLPESLRAALFWDQFSREKRNFSEDFGRGCGLCVAV